MTYQVSWLVERRVISLKISGDHSATDVYRCDEELVALYQSTPFEKIHLLIDFVDARSLPAISIIIKVKLGWQPNLGWIVMYGSMNPILRIIATTALRAFDLSFRAFTTRAEALQFLRITDSSLPELENTSHD